MRKNLLAFALSVVLSMSLCPMVALADGGDATAGTDGSGADIQIQCHVTYDYGLDGLEGYNYDGGITPADYQYGTEVTVAAAPEAPAGLKFAGWCAKFGDTPKNPGDKFTITEDVAFHGKWVAAKSISVTELSITQNQTAPQLAVNDESVGQWTATDPSYFDFTPQAVASQLSITATYSNDSGSTTFQRVVPYQTLETDALAYACKDWSAGSKGNKGDVNFYGKKGSFYVDVVNAEYVLTYHPNFEGMRYVAGPVEYGQVVTLAECTYTRPGFTFQGWSDAPDGTMRLLQPGDTIEITGNRTLYAQWAELVDVLALVPTPVPASGLVYNGKEQAGIEPHQAYTLRNGAATDAGEYVATVTLKSGYAWADGTEGAKKIEWKIAPAANAAKAAKTSVKKSYTAKALKKAAKTFSLPKVKTDFGTATWKVTTKDKKKVLSLSGGKVKVKKGAKKGAYTMGLQASVKATDNYAKASTKTVTVKVTVK